MVKIPVCSLTPLPRIVFPRPESEKEEEEEERRRWFSMMMMIVFIAFEREEEKKNPSAYVFNLSLFVWEEEKNRAEKKHFLGTGTKKSCRYSTAKSFFFAKPFFYLGMQVMPVLAKYLGWDDEQKKSPSSQLETSPLIVISSSSLSFCASACVLPIFFFSVLPPWIWLP